MTRDWMHAKYEALADTGYSVPLSDADFDYTWESFVGLVAFFEKAAGARRCILFTTDA